MAKFCGKCGAKLDETTGLCPNCDADKMQKDSAQSQLSKVPDQVQADTRASEKPLSRKESKKQSKLERKAQKKATKKKKRANWSTGKKVRRFFLKLILTVILLVVLTAGVMGALVYFGVVDIPFLSDFNQNSLLELVNERNIIVEEENIVMTSDEEGTATIVVTLPDYELLFESAITAENPDNYLLKALFFKDYETQEFELSANVTIENGERVIHSDEVVHQLLEERLVDAINALSEVR